MQRTLFLRAFSALLFVAIGGAAFGQILLRFEDFSAGAGSSFDLNSTGPAGNLAQAGLNQWVINNSYTSAPTYPITPNQNTPVGGAINNPNGNYLHVYNTASGVTGTHYEPVDASENHAVSAPICTQGLTDVRVSFFWIAAGNATEAFGQLLYTTDGGTTWAPTTSLAGRTNYFGQNNWRFETVTLPQFSDVVDLQFAFRWFNDGTPSFPGTALGFAIDDFQITAEEAPGGSGGITIDIPGTPATVCAGAPLQVVINHTNPLCAGEYRVELSDAFGNFSGANFLEFTNSLGTSTFGINTSINFTQFGNGRFVLIPAAITPIPGACYRLRVIRNSLPPPADTSVASVHCFAIEQCPTTITTLEPIMLSNPADTLCVGSALDVPFLSTGAYFNGNVYTAELSDSSGAFTAPSVVGTFASSDDFPDPLMPGQVSGQVPDVPDGCNYFLRVTSSLPNTPGTAITTYGPFCIKHCSIRTNETLDVNACITDTTGYTETLRVEGDFWMDTVNYPAPNTYQVQLLSPMDFSVVNQGGTGIVATSSTDTTLTLSIPPGNLLAPLGIAPGLYYLRLIATNAGDPTDTLGTLIRLNLGWPVADVDINLIAGDTVVCTGASNSVTLLAAPINPNNPPVSTLFWGIGNAPGGPFNVTPLSGGWSVNLSTGGSPGTIYIRVQEEHQGCLGEFSELFTVQIIEEPDLSTLVQGGLRACFGDTTTYTVPFNPLTAYAWSVAPGLNVLDTANNSITIVWDTLGDFDLNINAINECGAAQNSFGIRVLAYPNALALVADSLPGVPLGDTLGLCPGAPVQVRAEVDPPGLDFIWNYGGPVLTDTSFADFVPDEPDRLLVRYGEDLLSPCILWDTLEVLIAPPTSIMNDTAVCAGLPVSLQVSGGLNAAYSWSGGPFLSSPDTATPLARPEGPTTYTVQITQPLASDQACVSTEAVFVDQRPATELPPETLPLCEVGQEVLLQAPTGANAYTWSTGATTAEISVAQIDTYTVTLASGQDCETQSFYVVDDACGATITVPNVITPNGDGLNDAWVISVDGNLTRFSVQVFDRWGQKVFEANTVNEPWRPESDLPTGTYFYSIEAQAEGGSGVQQRSGNVTLLR